MAVMNCSHSVGIADCERLRCSLCTELDKLLCRININLVRILCRIDS